MKAEMLMRERYVLAEDVYAEIVVWRVPVPLRASRHDLKYRMALIARGKSVLRYDNEAGKGDHRHIGRHEAPYRFVSVEDLLADFWTDVERWMRQR
jgi:hypothetical protein